MSAAIVGATGAIGSALARRLFRAGTTPWLIGRSSAALESLSAELGGAPFTELDVADPAGIGAALKGQAPDGLRGMAYCVGDIKLKPFSA